MKRLSQLLSASVLRDTEKYTIKSTVVGYSEKGQPQAAPSIVCKTCKLESWNTNDVEQRYCGNCHVFHEEPRPSPPLVRE